MQNNRLDYKAAPPAMNVVQMFEPSHSPHAMTWMNAAALTGRNSVLRAATISAADTHASLTYARTMHSQHFIRKTLSSKTHNDTE